MFPKKIFNLLTLILCSTMMLNAQALKISTGTITYDGLTQPSIKVLLEPGTKDVKKAYKSWMEGEQDVDVDGLGFLKNKDVLKSEKQNINSISSKKIDLYARIVEAGDKTEMQVYGNVGYDIPITPQDFPMEYTRMRKLVYNFLNDYLPGYYEEEVEDTEDLVNDIKDDKSDAKDELQSNKEEIEELKKENEELASAIKEYEEKLKSAEKALDQTKSKKAKVLDKIEENK